ncbi:MAG: hypothetical protein ACLP7A_00835 [Desulfobaccales bacterium]
MNESPLKTGRNGRALGLRLGREPESILVREGLSRQVTYRLAKIRQSPCRCCTGYI